MLVTLKSFLSNRKVSIQVNEYIDMSFVPLIVLLRGLYCHHFCLVVVVKDSIH